MADRSGENTQPFDAPEARPLRDSAEPITEKMGVVLRFPNQEERRKESVQKGIERAKEDEVALALLDRLAPYLPFVLRSTVTSDQRFRKNVADILRKKDPQTRALIEQRIAAFEGLVSQEESPERVQALEQKKKQVLSRMSDAFSPEFYATVFSKESVAHLDEAACDQLMTVYDEALKKISSPGFQAEQAHLQRFRETSENALTIQERAWFEVAGSQVRNIVAEAGKRFVPVSSEPTAQKLQLEQAAEDIFGEIIKRPLSKEEPEEPEQIAARA